MSLSAAVTAQFKLIVRHKCTSGAHWNAGCLFHLSTAAFGYFLIFVVALAQLPLVYKVLRYKQGNNLISPVRIGFLAFVSSNNVAYAVNKNLPISTWGEGVLQLAQYLIIINLIFIHLGRHRQAVAFTLIYVTVMVGSLTPIVPAKFLIGLKVSNIFIDALGKVDLMYRCHKNGAPVDSVSRRRSLVLLNLCALGRLLTACVHSHDALLQAAYAHESLSTLALTTFVMVARRRTKRRSKIIDGEDDGISSGEEYSSSSYDDGRKGMRRRRRKEEEDEETSSGNEESLLFYREKRGKRRCRRDQWKSEDEGGSSSGMDEVFKLERRKDT